MWLALVKNASGLYRLLAQDATARTMECDLCVTLLSRWSISEVARKREVLLIHDRSFYSTHRETNSWHRLFVAIQEQLLSCVYV